jgi:hypothetical protein
MTPTQKRNTIGLIFVVALGTLGLFQKNELAEKIKEDPYAKPVATTKFATHLELLHKLTHEDVAVIERAFAGDPRWQLSEFQGGTIATLRKQTDDGFTLASEGFINNFASDRGRVTVIFGDRRLSDWWTPPGRLQTFAPSAKLQKVKLFNYWEGSTTYSSLVSIKAAAPLIVEVYEIARGKNGREFTEYYLYQVQEMIAKALKNAADIQHWGVIPKNGLKADDVLPQIKFACLSQRKGCPDREYSARFVFNPGEAGAAYLKVFTEGSEDPIDFETVSYYTNEVMGWSSEAAQMFLYNSILVIPKSEKGPINAELWFQPRIGGPGRKISFATIHLPPISVSKALPSYLRKALAPTPRPRQTR